MGARLGVILISAALLVYLAVVAQMAFAFVASGNAIAIVMGISLVLFPLLGFWLLLREVWFGLRAATLGRILEAEGALPEEELSVSPSGRLDPNDADQLFPQYRDITERNPDDWRAWFRLGLVYDAARDRRRARAAIRAAIRLQGQQPE